MPSGAYTIRNRSRNVDYVALLARGVTKFYMSVACAEGFFLFKLFYLLFS